MILLSIIFATCSTASIMEIPDAISVLIVLANLEHADLIVRLPKIGILIAIFAKSCSPTELLLNALQPTTIAATMMINSHHLCIMKLLAATIIRVASGSCVPISANILEKLGITITITTITTMIMTMNTTIGYVIAPLIFADNALSFSKCSVSLSRQISRLPDNSPAATMLIMIGGNTSEFTRSASASVPPFSTYVFASITALCSVLFSIWSPISSSADIIVTPALITAENCLQKTAKSFDFTFFLIKPPENGLFCSVRLMIA